MISKILKAMQGEDENSSVCNGTLTKSAAMHRQFADVSVPWLVTFVSIRQIRASAECWLECCVIRLGLASRNNEVDPETEAMNPVLRSVLHISGLS